MQTFRSRASFLVMCVVLSVVVVACGRASQEEIDEALGSTPTMTDQELALETQQALGEQQTREAVAQQMATPGNAGSVDIASTGNPVLGRTTFAQRCMGCHKAGGQGPDLTGPTSPINAMTDQEIIDFLRTGEGHTPPGPLTTVDISDSNMPNLLAYLREQAK
jgi:mono/diheme cytochrome c family protein